MSEYFYLIRFNCRRQSDQAVISRVIGCLRSPTPIPHDQGQAVLAQWRANRGKLRGLPPNTAMYLEAIDVCDAPKPQPQVTPCTTS